MLFISYWGVDEGLTKATVLPHLKILAENGRVDEIDFITIERSGVKKKTLDPKIDHHILKTSSRKRDKLFDQFRFNRVLRNLYSKKRPDVIFARSTMAGWLVLKFSQTHRIPLSVESFEPHSEYMLESGVWKKSGFRYKTLFKSENKQKQFADYLFPVTKKYSDYLIEKENVSPEKVMPMPCCVNAQLFQFNQNDRLRIREELNLQESSIIAIYTGKFGGIYLQDEAVSLMKLMRNSIGENFFLLILSPDNEIWQNELLKAGFNRSNFHIGFVSQEQVPAYLSASDIALSLHKPTPSKMAISPIKNAEYWSNGLPIIMPQGIGDDSEITSENPKLGLVIENFSNLDPENIDSILPLTKEDRLNNDRVRFAKTERSFDIVKDCYNKILSELNS